MIEVSIHYPTNREVGKPAADEVRIELVLPKHPFMFWSCLPREHEAIQFPKGYGVAYRSYEKDSLLFAPMPFNILIGAAIHIYHWTRIGFAASVWKHEHRIKK